MIKVIIINGMPTAGKSTFVKLCERYYGPMVREISTVDFVKDLAYKCGWDGEKTPKNRRFLSDLKDLLTEWDDVPYKKIQKAYDDFKFELEQYGLMRTNAFLFINCREPKEIQKLKDGFNAKTLLIRREAVETEDQSNHADANVFNFEYDYVINNAGSLEELSEMAKDFLKLLSI